MRSFPSTVGWACALLALGLAAAPAASQPAEEARSGEPLVTDRPDFTESAVSVDPRRIQIEAGYTRERSGDEDTDSIGELLLRIGLTRALELRIAPNSYLREISHRGPDAEGIEDPTLGLKWEIASGSETPSLLAPTAAVILSTTVPVGSKAVGSDEFLPAAVLALDWALGGPVGLASNLGLTTEADGDDRYLTGLASLAAGFDLGGSWGGYLEYYALIPEGSERDTQHFVDAGLTYLVSVDFQLDVRFGTELSGATDYFAGIGLAYRW